VLAGHTFVIEMRRFVTAASVQLSFTLLRQLRGVVTLEH
jgi:hypothetical protein